MLLMIRDVDLLINRSRKRTKGNDGEVIRHVNGDYRLVYVRIGKDGTIGCSYFSMVRFYLEMAVELLDENTKERGENEREDQKQRWHRRYAARLVGEDPIDDDENEHDDPIRKSN